MNEPIWRWTAERTARAIRTREVSSREAVQSVLDRVAAVNPRINAVVDLMADDALAEADRADKAVQRGENLGLLHGVPVTVKINIDYAGRATTNGVVAFKNNIAEQDSAPVANLKKAGAIIFGRTNTPAFSHRHFTDNDLHGRTLNPWNPARTPGGSSGGAGAAVCSGMGAIAHGNDRAGSVRYPAYACGVVGLRPTMGRVAGFNPSAKEERGLFSQMTFIDGPLGRSISDVRLGLAALEGWDARDPAWTPAAPTRSVAKPIPVAMVTSHPDADIDPKVPAAIRRAAKLLEDAGFRVEEVIPPDFQEPGATFWKLVMTEERSASEAEQSSSTRAIELYGDEAVKRVRAGYKACVGEYDLDGYIKALARRNAIIRNWRMFLARYPLVLMPASWQLPFPIDYDQGGNEAMGRALEATLPLLTISALGLPGLSVPTGLVDGVPTGVQVVADRFQEDLCFAAGEVIQAGCPVSIPEISN